jgi:hypothetical protein
VRQLREPVALVGAGWGVGRGRMGALVGAGGSAPARTFAMRNSPNRLCAVGLGEISMWWMLT